MAIFKPIMVQKKENLSSVTKKGGQYIVVIDENELYLDKSETERVKVSQNIYIQPESNVPTNAKNGDVWFVTE